MPNKISVIMITKNNERLIEKALESVKWADEIIILDSGSTDNTLSICKKYTNKITKTNWPGFGKQKQRALEQASHDWVLSLDADEIVSPKLTLAIKRAIESDKYNGYTINRPLVFAGKICRHCIGTPYTLRLFKKSASYFTDDYVHESVVTKGKIGKIKQEMLHYSYENYADWLKKMNQYTSYSVDSKRKKGKKSSILKAIFSSKLCFLKIYILKGGFLDGKVGFLVAINWAIGNYIKYIKLAMDDQF